VGDVYVFAIPVRVSLVTGERLPSEGEPSKRESLVTGERLPSEDEPRGRAWSLGRSQ
jgi:hypothetical protein